MAISDAALVAGNVLRAGIQFHQRGDLANAEGCYHSALQMVPEHPYALNLLGLAAYQRGRFEEGARLARRAIAIYAKDAKFHVNLGNCLRGQKLHDEAAAAYERALSLDGRLVEAWNGLGNLQREAGRLEGAIDCYRRALQAVGTEATLAMNLAVALHESGRPAEALPVLEAFAARFPSDAEAQYNLGNALAALDRPKEAAAALRRAVELRPGFARAWYNLGNVLFEQAQHGEAAQAFRRALDADPSLDAAWINLANAFAATGDDHAQAAEAFTKALEIDPSATRAYLGLAKLLEKAGRYVEVVQCCERALAFDPKLAHAWEMKAGALWNQGLLTHSSDAFRHALEHAPQLGGALGNFLFAQNYLDDLEPQRLAALHREHAARIYQGTPARLPRRAEGRRRVGFVGGDFRLHSVAYFLLPLLERLDVEVLCYYTDEKEDEYTARFRRIAAQWVVAKKMSDEALAERIRSDRVDVLFDLAGHTSGSRLGVFARRAAPVQATWLGYPTTTGLAQMDYRLTDPVVDPLVDPEGLNTERPLRLSVSYFCYGGPGVEPEIGALPAHASGSVTFGSFNNLAKMSPTAMRLWARVLKALPASRLVLKSRALSDAKTAEDVLERFAALGIARARLALSGWKAGLGEHLEAYREIDVALDSFPYNGATTTCEALWMGVPVVSLSGASHASRMGASILRAAGLGELVTTSEEQFLHVVLSLATDLQSLAALRAGLRERIKTSALMDAGRFAREFAAAVEAMAQRA